jgi:hypothetical protein
MKIAKQLTPLIALAAVVFVATPVIAAEDDAKAFGQFQEVLEGINDGSFAQIQRVIDKTDMTNRVYSARTVEIDAKQVFGANFWQFIESGYMSNLPNVGSRSLAEVVDFEFQDGLGRAAVRFNLPQYAYAFQVFDLRHDNRGRMIIVDWFDSSTGQMFTADIAEALTVLMPTKEATRRQISVESPSDLQLFQVTEIYKATRDMQPPRFFEIYDAFDEQLKRDPFIAKNAVKMAFMLEDIDRFERSLEVFNDVYPENSDFALMMSDMYMVMKAYDRSYASLRRFHENYSVGEGALPARLSALALALGQAEEAEAYAVEATVDEPLLELGWWSLLRARAAAENNQGSIEVLAHLEDNFGHRLDVAKLRRDKFRGFSKLAASQEFQDWRASRD